MKILAVLAFLMPLSLVTTAYAFTFRDVTGVRCRSTSESFQLNRKTGQVHVTFRFGEFANTVGGRRDPIVPTSNGLQLVLSTAVQGVNSNDYGTVSVGANAWENSESRRMLVVVFKKPNGQIYGAPMNCDLETK